MENPTSSERVTKFLYYRESMYGQGRFRIMVHELGVCVCVRVCFYSNVLPDGIKDIPPWPWIDIRKIPTWWITINKKVKVSKICLNNECIGFLYLTVRVESARKNTMGISGIKTINVWPQEREPLGNNGT